MAACWRALAKVPGVESCVLTARYDDPRIPGFDDDIAAGFDCRLLSAQQFVDNGYVFKLVQEADPQIVVICGWACQPYTKLALDSRMAGVKMVMAMDTPWRRTLRQRVARLKIGPLIDRMDAVMVPGERAWQYASNLQVPQSRIYRGMYGIDYQAFAPLYQQRANLAGGWPKQFLFCGRYIDIKGMDILLEAYRIYRLTVTDPWPLVCCGGGDMQTLVDAAKSDGVIDLGFVQPRDLPQLWLKSSALLLPSRFDPWPLVVVEASSAGLPVICTEACGSAIEIVRDLYSGRVIPSGDLHALVRAMKWTHDNYHQLPDLGRRAQEMATPYAAEVWAQRWTSMFQRLLTPQ